LHPIATYYDGFSLEHEFLLELLGSTRQEWIGKPHNHTAQIDWSHLFAITPPDIYGYLGYKLTEAGLQSYCPAPLLAETMNARRATAAQWLRLRFELRHLAAEFAKHRVDFLLLKGAALAFLAYPDSSLRSVSDLDVLVQSEYLAQALECVYAAGFHCPERYAHAGGLTESALPGEEISLPLEKPGTRALIEVHTQLESAQPWFPVAISQVWESSQEANLGGLRVRIPNPHEFLFHLILHLARAHLFSLGLRPLLDIHLWVEHQGERLDWQWIASECVRRGYAGWAHLTLRIGCDTFGTRIPATFFESVAAPAGLDRLKRLACEQIWADHRMDSLVPPRLVMTISERSAMAALSGLLRRASPTRNRQGSTVPPQRMLESDGWTATLQRMLNEVRLKTPQYIRAWRNGRMRWSNVQAAARLARGRTEIQRTLGR